VINWLFAGAFLASHWIGERPILARMLQGQVDIPQAALRQLSMAWVVFFFTMGCLNLFVMANFDTNTWVNFKMFGLLGMTFVFLICQSIWLVRHIKTEE